MKYLLLISILLFTGCTETKYVFVKPEYPTLKAPREVKTNDSIVVRDRCLFINDTNTNLCNEDLEIVLTQINKYKVNQTTCTKMVSEYDDFKKNQKTLEITKNVKM